MKIRIDGSLCQSQKLCFNLYPELFEETGEGQGCVKGVIEIVPEEFEVDAQSAVNACPVGATTIEY